MHRLCLVGALSLALTACSEGVSQQSLNTLEQSGQSRQQAKLILQGLQRLRESVSTQGWSADSSMPGAFVQTSAPFETWMFLAVMKDQQGRRYAMQQRLARLKVADGNAEVTSGWNFSHLLALDYRLEPVGGQGVIDTHTAQQADRVALSLAGTSVEQSKLWIGGFTTKRVASNQCTTNYEVQTPQVNLLFEQFSCASEQRSDSFVMTRSESMRVTGEYRFQQHALALEGRGWLVRAWGVPPDTSQTAVVFDRAWLWFEDTLDIQLQRSRRRSGRGPRIATGSVSKLALPGQTDVGDIQAEPLALSQPVLADLNAQVDTQALPTGFLLTENSQAIDVVLTSTHTAETVGVLELNRLMAVSVDGSHTGVGFVSYAVAESRTPDTPQ